MKSSKNDFENLIKTSSSCAIPETGFGSSPHIPVLSVCFSCFYTGIGDLLFNADSERLLERWLGNYTLIKTNQFIDHRLMYNNILLISTILFFLHSIKYRQIKITDRGTWILDRDPRSEKRWRYTLDKPDIKNNINVYKI